MKTREKTTKQPPKHVLPLRLTEIESSLHHMTALVKELTDKTESLPKVDRNGQSECPFAEDMFVEKEEAIKKTARQINTLRDHIAALNEEITVGRRNLELIQADSSRLRLNETRHGYSQAEESVENRHKKAIYLRKGITDTIPLAEAAIRKAKKKKWPLGEPKKRFRPELSQLGRMTNSGYPTSHRLGASSHPGGSLGQEVNSLMSLGPVNSTHPLPAFSVMGSLQK